MTDRERDALIAEKVFGWTKREDGHWTPPQYAGSVVFVYASDIPRYSSDSAASKQLREKLAEIGWEWRLARWTEKFQFSMATLKQMQTVRTEADTEELAVALAALKAMEEA